jgi:hypothetical protein
LEKRKVATDNQKKVAAGKTMDQAMASGSRSMCTIRTRCTKTGIMRIRFRKNTMSSFSDPGRRTTVSLLPPNSLLNYLQGWGLIELPLRATFSPAHPLASRDVLVAQARAFCFLLCTIMPSHPRESPNYPSLRASDEHRFIVRILRARRIVWRLPIPPF